MDYQALTPDEADLLIDWMRLADVPKYIERVHGVRVCLNTVYHWARFGRKTVVKKGQAYLQVKVRAHKLYTTKKWVNDFLDKE